MEGFQLQGLLVDIRATLLQRERIIQFRVEGQHVQLHRLTVHLLYGVHHVLNELRIRGARWVDPYHHLRLLGLLLVRTLRTHLFAIGVNRLLAHLISSHDGRSQEFEQSRRKRLSAGRVANNQRRVIQPAQFLRTMIEAISTSCHQGHQQTAAYKQCRRILVPFEPFADILYQRIIFTQRLNLSTPFPEPLADVLLCGCH